MTETSCALFSFSYSCHGHASVADTIFSLTVLFGIRQSSRAFLSSSISSPRVRSTFSSLFLPFYCSLYMFSSVLIEKNRTETSMHAIPIFRILVIVSLQWRTQFSFSLCYSAFVSRHQHFCRHQYHHHEFQYTIASGARTFYSSTCTLQSVPTIFFASKRTVYI